MLPTHVNRLPWQTFSEDVSSVDIGSKMIVSGLLDQLSVTRDASDYLWYSTRLEKVIFLNIMLVLKPVHHALKLVRIMFFDMVSITVIKIHNSCCTFCIVICTYILELEFLVL